MALEAVVCQQQDLFGHSISGKDLLYPLLLESCEINDNASSYDYLLENNNNQSELYDWCNYYHCDEDHYGINNNSISNNSSFWEYSTSVSVSPPSVDNGVHQWSSNTSSYDEEKAENNVVARPKRRRARAKKNKEDIENQRMTHITVERNRRKQMNEYLNVLRSLMPDSYVQRGDQASIIGGAINFVKELEQNLQYLSANKHNNCDNHLEKGSPSTSSLPFGEFFTFPQYSTTSNNGDDNEMKGALIMNHQLGSGTRGGSDADVEVTMVESHALLKIRSKRPPKQLSKIVSGLQGLRLTILHVNVTKVDGVALFSFSVKVNDESNLSSVDEIAGAVYQMLGRIQEETTFNC